MAATNFTPIQIYFSTTASAVPLAANLAQGELAINITDGKLYYEDNAGAVQVIATKGAGTIGGSTTQIQYNNAGALAGNAAMVFNNSTNVTTLTTLNLTNALGATFGGTAQSTYAQGDIVYASATNTLSKLGIGTVNYILTSNGTVPQWVAPSSISVLTATNLAGGAAGSVPYQSGVATTTFLAIGTANRVMTSTGTAPQWVTALTGLTGVSSSSITNTGLTSGRVVYSTTGGLETDSANLTFDGTNLTLLGGTANGVAYLNGSKVLTTGSAFVFDGTSVGIGTSSPLYKLSIATTTGGGMNMTNGVDATLRVLLPTTGITYDNVNFGYHAWLVGGSEKMRLDSSGNVLVTNVAGLGYGTGSGGTVTQATSKSTGVTLNKPAGKITMNNAALLPSTSVIFILTNSLVGSNDLVLANTDGFSNYTTDCVAVTGSGTAYIRVTNISGSSLSDAVVINFAIIKGATS